MSIDRAEVLALLDAAASEPLPYSEQVKLRQAVVDLPDVCPECCRGREHKGPRILFAETPD